jgi:hypothetical protein
MKNILVSNESSSHTRHRFQQAMCREPGLRQTREKGACLLSILAWRRRRLRHAPDHIDGGVWRNPTRIIVEYHGGMTEMNNEHVKQATVFALLSINSQNPFNAPFVFC